jgi:hypothetical protein
MPRASNASTYLRDSMRRARKMEQRKKKKKKKKKKKQKTHKNGAEPIKSAPKTPVSTYIDSPSDRSNSFAMQQQIRGKGKAGILCLSALVCFIQKGHTKKYGMCFYGGDLWSDLGRVRRSRGWRPSFVCLSKKKKKMFSWAVRCCSRWAHCVVWWPFGARMLP